MTRKIFPINTEPACLLKWSWSTIFFNSGTSASCHRTKKYSIDPNNFSNFHNLPEKIHDRNMMLQGQWPGNGCEYCRDIEQSGGISDRQFQIESQSDLSQHPPELNKNPQTTKVTPTILEVYFTNTCNMACVYCGPHFSSKWEDENRKFKSNFNAPMDIFGVDVSQHNPHYDKMLNDLWAYLETDNRYRTLRRFHLLGGEPFILKELDATIDFWDQHGNMDLVFSIITNLNVPHERFKKYMGRFEKLINEKKIWKIQITASLDAWGPQQEYTRYGLDLALWEKNFEYLIDKQWVTLSINSAISALTVKQMPELIKKINYWNTLRGPLVKTVDNVFGEAIYHSFNTTGPSSYDNLYIFGNNVFGREFEEILNLMPVADESQSSTKLQLESVANRLAQSHKDQEKINKLKDYLTILDQRRNTVWQTMFPWLVDL